MYNCCGKAMNTECIKEDELIKRSGDREMNRKCKIG
jgi:hypothetical protein